MTEDEFIAQFKPEENEHGGYYRQRNWYDPTDQPAIQLARDENRLWSVVEGDEGEFCISSGFHYVNLLYYIICAVPTYEDITIIDDDF